MRRRITGKYKVRCSCCHNFMYVAWSLLIRKGVKHFFCKRKCFLIYRRKELQERNAIMNILNNPMWRFEVRLKNSDSKRMAFGHKGYPKFMGTAIHRDLAEIEVGRPLRSSDIVHHKDRNRSNVNQENIQITTRVGHIYEHLSEMQAARRMKGGDAK